MKLHKQIAALAVILLLPVMASAEWERTLGAWDTLLPNKGKFQASLWGNYDKGEVANADITGKAAFLEMSYGIADNWSAYVSPSYSSWNLDGGGSESGFADTMLQTTYRFSDETADNYGLAFMGKVRVPTGDEDKNLSGGKYEPGAELIASRKYGPVVAVANIDLTTVINPDKGEKNFVLTSILEGVYPLNDKLSLNAALAAATATTAGENVDLDLAVGSRYNVSGRMFVGGMIYKCVTEGPNWGLELAAGLEF